MTYPHQIQNSSPQKRTSRKRKVVFIFLLIILLLFIGHCILVKIGSRERQTDCMETDSSNIYSLKSRLNLLSLMPEVKNAATKGRAAEIDYGTYTIPGLDATLTQVHGDKQGSAICTSMVPQGLAVTEKYLLVSAYCYSGTHNSVIYVIDKKDHTFIKEVVLKNKAHVGGLAYDPIHHNIWISGMSRGVPQVNAIPMSLLETYSFEKEHLPIVYSQSYDLYAITRSSFLTYHDNSLYVGYFTQNTASVLEQYNILDDGTLETRIAPDPKTKLDLLTPIALPADMRVITSRAQGVAFYKDKLLFSHSYGLTPSRIQVYENSFNKILEESATVKSILLPEKLEQIYVDNDDLYVLFESAAYGYRLRSVMKMDRILKLDLKELLS